jgi:hypothetical protein
LTLGPFNDAAYLALALRHALSLATLDASLAQAAEREKISLVGRVAGRTGHDRLSPP